MKTKQTLVERAFYLGSMDDNLAPMKDANDKQWQMESVVKYILLVLAEDTGRDIPRDKAEEVIEAYKRGFLSTH